MAAFPPEKYYEACITYHLVSEFRDRYDRRLYPFSISQIEEKDKGFDFGYNISSQSFYVQYKRPFSFEVQKSMCSWQIDMTQLNIINNQPYALQTYYALPAFVDIDLWFEGFDNTYFIEATKLGYYLQQYGKKKTHIVHSSLKTLKSWSDFFARFSNTFQNTIAQEKQEFSFDKIKNYAMNLDKNARDRTWVYLLEAR